MPAKKLPVTKTALVQRMRRRLADENTHIRVTGIQGVLLDAKLGRVIEEIEDIEEFARNKGILQTYEALAK